MKCLKTFVLVECQFLFVINQKLKTEFFHLVLHTFWQLQPILPHLDPEKPVIALNQLALLTREQRGKLFFDFSLTLKVV